MQSRSLHQKRALCFVLIVLLLSAVGMTKANPVDLRTAREVGMKFMNANTNTPLRNIGDLQLVTTYSISRGDAAFYVFNMPNGFVIVAADDCSTPILGYSNKEHFNMDNIPVQMQEYLQGFVEQIQYGIDHHLSANETVSRRWELVKATGRITEQRAITTVSPLLTDSWGQGCYYNALCPEDANGPCGHTMTGCTGTAMGQIMRFWSYPSSGSGSMVYTPTGYPEQSVDFAATTYQWANMPNSLSSSSSSTQINAVATLLWHCGIALQAIYGPDGTSAQPSQVPGVLVGIFNYSSDLYGAYKSNYSDSTWLSMIKNNLDYGRPIHYSGWNSQGGNGHSFVCDGYDSNDYLHFNWGWHGSYNNSYFALDALVVSNYDFSYGNYAIFDIHPNCSSGTYYQINTTASPSNGGTVYGSGPYNCGNDCTLTAVPADGYIFCSWTENGEMVSIEPTYSFTAFENRDLVANFIAGEGCSLVFNFYDSYGDGWNGNALTVSNSEGCYSYEELTFTDGMSATISRNVVDGNHIVLGWMPGSWTSECSFTVSYENGTMICEGSNLSNGFSYEFDVDCDSPLPIYYTITTETNPSNGGTVSGDGSFIYGQTCTLVAAANSGYGFTNWTKNDTTVSTHATYSFTVTENAVYVANFSATVPSTPTLQVVAKYYPDANNPASPYVKVYWGEEMVEHFETDDFGLFDWQMDPYYPWTITTSNPYEGPYCMVSGGSGVANVVSNMTVTVNIPADGEMSFWGKISCESNWDYGYFYIDSIQKGSYTGDGNWGEKKFEITAGEHTFQWRYTKDGSVNSNDDCFYVDYITFYRRPEPLGPGWHTYCESEFNNALGSELTTSPSWAYEYPASFLHDNYAGFNITKVSLFSDDMYSAVGGNYTCCIYVGGTMPAAGTMVSTITVDVPSNQNDWVDWDLTTPVNVTGTDPIWVVWTANTTVSSWPAGLCNDQNDYGNWWDSGSGWEHQTYGTWTMRHWFTNRTGNNVAVGAVDDAFVAVGESNLTNSLRTFVKGDNSSNTICANPNAVKGDIFENSNTRTFYYTVYRANCDGSGMQVIANNLTEHQYIDTEWPEMTPGNYKYGVSIVSNGQEKAIHWVESLSSNTQVHQPLTLKNAEAIGLEICHTSFANSSSSSSREMWDLLNSFECTSAYQYGVATDGQNIYTCSWSANSTSQFYKYDMQGNFIEEFNVSGSGQIRDLTYDGQYFYGVANSSTIYCLDLANHTLVNTITSAYGTMRCCGYDPQRDGFWVVGNWSGNLTLIDRTGAIQQVGPTPLNASGVAYYVDDNDVEHVLLFCQPSSNCMVYDYDIATNTLSSSPIFDFSYNTHGCIGTSGGCHIGEYNGKIAFFGDTQQGPNLIGIYELGNRQIIWSNYIEKQVTTEQSIELAAGWNWFSTNLDITLDDLKSALVDALGDTTIVINSQSDGNITYNGNTWRGQLNIFDVTQMYMIKTTSECLMTLTGIPINPVEHPITIRNGFNWIGFTLNENKALSNAFSEFAVNGDIVISQFGSATYNGQTWRGSLGTLESGKGYMYKSNIQDDRVFTFPINTK